MAKNKNSKKAQAEAQMAEKVKMLPTIYRVNFKDIPSQKYGEALDLLFRDPDFGDVVAQRNKLVDMAGRMRQGSAEMQNLVKQIQARDKKLADIMYAAMVQVNVRSDVTYDFLSFQTLLKYFVDYSKPGMRERVSQLSSNLDKITFLSDVLEGILTDVKGDMLEIFGSTIEFNQFDGVLKMIHQIRGYFRSAIAKDENSKEGRLYYEYATSINEYMDKRLKTYSEKYRKLHPTPLVYTAKQLVEGLNFFFDAGSQFDENFIHRTENGGAYIDAISLAYNLSKSQTERLDDLLTRAKNKCAADKDPTNYCFAVTTAIMLYYEECKKQKK